MIIRKIFQQGNGPNYFSPKESNSDAKIGANIIEHLNYLTYLGTFVFFKLKTSYYNPFDVIQCDKYLVIIFLSCFNLVLI